MHIRHGRQDRRQHCAELEQPLQLAMHIMAFCGHTHGHVRIDIAIACTTLTCCSSFKVSVSTAAALLCCCTCAAVLTCAARQLQGTAPQHHSTTSAAAAAHMYSSTAAHALLRCMHVTYAGRPKRPCVARIARLGTDSRAHSRASYADAAHTEPPARLQRHVSPVLLER